MYYAMHDNPGYQTYGQYDVKWFPDDTEVIIIVGNRLKKIFYLICSLIYSIE